MLFQLFKYLQCVGTADLALHSYEAGIRLIFTSQILSSFHMEFYNTEEYIHFNSHIPLNLMKSRCNLDININVTPSGKDSAF